MPQDPRVRGPAATTVEFDDPHALTRSTTRPRATLAWRDETRAHTIDLTHSLVVGSAAMADVVLDDRAVSRLHAEFELRADGVWVRDLGSTNGTFVDEMRVGLARVPEGGRVRLGAASVLTLAYEREPSRVALWPEAHFGPLVGASVAARELFALLARVAPLDSTVLIQGETGTGKELVARGIHDASRRAAEPFVVVDCAGLPETLLESELFGHARGAFTGAVGARAGAIEAAEGGTVFLDEIGELPLAMQPKLLRVLESRTVRRLGETTPREVDVRFVSATHRDLRTMVNQGAFREDLYFRLAVLPVAVPPLRERADDVPLLLQHFLHARGAPALSATTLARLAERPWLGNVRELRNFAERAAGLGERAAMDLLGDSRTSIAPPSPGGSAASELPAVATHEGMREARERWIDHFEREYVRQLLETHERNVPLAAQAAGVDKTYIYRLIRKHRL